MGHSSKKQPYQGTLRVLDPRLSFYHYFCRMGPESDFADGVIGPHLGLAIRDLAEDVEVYCLTCGQWIKGSVITDVVESGETVPFFGHCPVCKGYYRERDLPRSGLFAGDCPKCLEQSLEWKPSPSTRSDDPR